MLFKDDKINLESTVRRSKQLLLRWASQHTPVVSVLRRLRQEDCWESEVSLRYVLNWRPSTQILSQKQTIKKPQLIGCFWANSSWNKSRITKTCRLLWFFKLCECILILKYYQAFFFFPFFLVFLFFLLSLRQGLVIQPRLALNWQRSTCLPSVLGLQAFTSTPVKHYQPF